MTDYPDEHAACVGFEWDAGNVDKNWERHRVSAAEAEQVFFQRPLLIAPASRHSSSEPRYAALGRTTAGRRLTVVFTIRERLIRVISARPMSRRERGLYEPREEDPVISERAQRFPTEDEERDFWAEHDVVDYFDWERSVTGSFPALKPSTQSISLRLPKALLEDLKVLANERDVPYQSLMKIFLAERVARERSGMRDRRDRTV